MSTNQHSSSSTHHPHIAMFGLKGFPAIGGTAAVGENIVRELNDRFRFTVYATSSHAKLKTPYNNVQLFIFRKILPHKLNVFYYNLMAAFHAVLFGSYDLVHTHQIDTAYIIPILRLRYRVVATHHGKTYQMSKWGSVMKLFFQQTEKIMIRWANQVTFVAESERQDAQEKYRGHFLTINNGFSPLQEIAEIDERNEYIMFAAGRILPHKGCHDFLEALKRIAYKGKVLIAGDHHQLSDYRQKLDAYQADLDIHFLGMIKDKSKLLGYVKKACLFVFPSYYEAMSMMLLEVASVKTPLICSDIRENTSVFDQEEVEFYQSGNVSDLASRMKHFLDHPDSLNHKIDKAYLKLTNKYQWKHIAKQYADVYKEFVTNRK